MTEKKKQILKELALLVAGILIGTGIGYTKIAPFLKWSTMSSTGNGMVGYAEIQYYKAKYPSALKAQKEYLSYLVAVEKKKPEWSSWSVPWMTEQILNYDKAITYARIALLEGGAGNHAEAKRSWAIAEIAAAAAGWKNPSREHILKIVNAKESEFHKLEENAQPGR